MDVLYFLERRTAFIRGFYTQTSAPYIETKRKIDAYEEPFSWPSGYEDSEPPFLAEWQEADEALEFLGQACVSFLSAALKLFLNESEREFRNAFDGLPLPAGTTAELKPGGHHLMFIQPTRALPAGEQVDATLVFERAGRMPVVFEVRPLGAAAPKPHQ